MTAPGREPELRSAGPVEQAARPPRLRSAPDARRRRGQKGQSLGGDGLTAFPAAPAPPDSGDGKGLEVGQAPASGRQQGPDPRPLVADGRTLGVVLVVRPRRRRLGNPGQLGLQVGNDGALMPQGLVDPGAAHNDQVRARPG